MQPDGGDISDARFCKGHVPSWKLAIDDLVIIGISPDITMVEVKDYI